VATGWSENPAVLILERGVHAASTSASADSPEFSKSLWSDGRRSDLKVELRESGHENYPEGITSFSPALARRRSGYAGQEAEMRNNPEAG